MRKLKLALASLEVQSFPVDGENAAPSGTIQAYDSVETTYGPWFCPYYCDTMEGGKCP
jgi:hypothetical protein